MARKSAFCAVAYSSTAFTCAALRPVVSRMLAYTVCRASARARDARAPKPLDAPVTRITCFIKILLRSLPSVRKPAVDPQHLRIDPPALRSCKEGDHPRDVVGLAQPLERREFRQFRDLLLALSAEEQLRSDGSGRYGVHGDISPTHFVGQHVNQPLDATLRSDVRTIGR